MHSTIHNQNEERHVDYIESLLTLTRTYLRRWNWVLLILAAFILAGLAYSRYSKLIYTSRGLIMIQDEQKGNNSSELSVLKDLGILKGESNVSNEIELLRSRTLIGKVADELHLTTELYALSKTTGLLRRDLYLRSPFNISVSGVDSIPVLTELDLYLKNAQHYQISCSELNFSSQVNLGDTIATPFGAFCISTTSLMSDEFIGKNYLIRLVPRSRIVDDLQEKLSVKQLSKESTVIEVTMSGPNIERDNDIINTLFKQREIDAIEDNNKIARKTSELIIY